MGKIDDRLTELGIEIPKAAAPMANYVGWQRTGNLVFTAGQGPVENGDLKFLGTVGDSITQEQANEAARLCGINMIAQVRAACDGNLDKVVRVVKLLGFVNGVSDFKDHPAVINGASDLMVDVFGEKGKHARSAVGAGSLPFGMSVEIEGIFEIESD